jgi:chromosome segregation ATPase
VKTYTPTRKDWIEATKHKLDELDAGLTLLESRLDQARSEVQDELRTRVASARQGLTAARERWSRATDTASDAWDQVSEEIGTAWELNKVALERSISEIRAAMDRIA